MKSTEKVNRKQVRTLHPGAAIAQRERRLRILKNILDEEKVVFYSFYYYY